MGALLILLNILKIIGIILLIILILIVTLLCIVLFVPFRYHFEGRKNSEISGMGWVQWLFGILRLDLTYEGAQGDVNVRILGRSLSEITNNRANKRKAKQRSKRKKRNVNKQVEKPRVQVVASEETFEKTGGDESPCKSRRCKRTADSYC